MRALRRITQDDYDKKARFVELRGVPFRAIASQVSQHRQLRQEFREVFGQFGTC